MAKTTTPKTETKAEPKAKAKPKTKATTSAGSIDLLEQASGDALQKLQELGIEPQLQADLEWCLGSYRHDKNPSGLITAVSKAVEVLNKEKAKKTKGVTAKLITDLEKALKTQGQ